MFNECLEIRLNTAYFASLTSPKIIVSSPHKTPRSWSKILRYSSYFQEKKRNKGNNAHLFLNTHAHPSRLKHRFDLHLIY